MSKISQPVSESATRLPSSRTAFSKQHLVILLIAACLLCTLASEEWLSIGRLSMTFDEGAHLYAGYQHWTARDFGVNPEHPPLVKLVAAAPLLAMHIKPPNPPRFMFLPEQYVGGDQLLAENGGYRLLTSARMAASLFTFALALLLLAAGWEMFSPPVGLLALALFTFEPTILAHGALVTTDMGVACFIFAAVFAFYRYLKSPGLLRLIVCGLAVGLALSAKVSGALVLPALGLIALREIAVAPAARARKAGTLVGALLVISFVGYFVLWGFYTFRYAARPGGLVITPPLAAMAHMGPRPWETNLVMHLAASHLFPEGYLFAWTKLATPLTATAGFLFGRMYPTGTWIYFPAVLLIKSTLTLLVLLAAAPFVLKRFQREAVIPAIALLTILLACMPSSLNTGVRHVLAIYPFAILLAAASAWAIARRSRVGTGVVAALLLCQCATSLHAYPDYLPYANEAFGGSSRTYRMLTDSNVDWAQQLKEVNAWTASHHVTDCWLAYSYIDGIPGYTKSTCRLLPSGLATLTGHTVPPVPTHIQGTLIIGAADAAGVLWGPGSLNPYQQFQDAHPAELIANSALVYRGDFDLPMVAAESHLGQATMLLRRGQPDAALKEVEAAIAADPQSASVQADAGSTLLQMHKLPEAQQAFATAARESEGLPREESQAIAHRIAEMQQPQP
jgi:4-amino-4-deoxy-L-arabinose transferase-like glycosyltransferase